MSKKNKIRKLKKKIEKDKDMISTLEQGFEKAIVRLVESARSKKMLDAAHAQMAKHEDCLCPAVCANCSELKERAVEDIVIHDVCALFKPSDACSCADVPRSIGFYMTPPSIQELSGKPCPFGGPFEEPKEGR